MPIEIKYEYKGFKQGNYVRSNEAVIGFGIYQIDSFWFWNGNKEPQVHLKNNTAHWPVHCLEHVFKVS